MYLDLRIKQLLLLSCFSENLFLDRFSEKYSDIKFHENPYIRSRAVQCGRTDRKTWRS